MKSTHIDSLYYQARQAIDTAITEFEAVRGDYTTGDTDARTREANAAAKIEQAKEFMALGRYNTAKMVAIDALRVLEGN